MSSVKQAADALPVSIITFFERTRNRARGGRDILDIPPLITLADMDKRPGRFEGSLQDMAK